MIEKDLNQEAKESNPIASAAEEPENSATSALESTEESGAQSPIEADPSDIQTVVFTCPVDHSGTHVQVKGWLAQNPQGRPPIVIVHDLGENISCYRRIAKEFCRAGFSTYAFDLRGHGRSGGKLGHIPPIAEMIRDMLQVCAWIRHSRQEDKVIFLAQGFGSTVASAFSERYPQFCAAKIFCSPAGPNHSYFSATRLRLLKILAEVAPQAKPPRSLIPRLFAPDLVKVPAHSATKPAPRPVYRLTAGGLCNVLEALQLQTQSEPGSAVSHPTLILIPGQSNLYDYSNRAGTLETVPSANHHMLTSGEDEADDGLRVILPWLEQQWNGDADA